MLRSACEAVYHRATKNFSNSKAVTPIKLGKLLQVKQQKKMKEKKNYRKLNSPLLTGALKFNPPKSDSKSSDDG